MKKGFKFFLSATLAMAFLSSCTHRLVDFTVISSKNVPITEESIQFAKAQERVIGKDTKWQILFIPGIPDMKEAIDRAIEKYPGAVALTDGVIYSSGWTIGLLGQNSYKVEGTPLYPTKTSAETTSVQNNGQQYSVQNYQPATNHNQQNVQQTYNNVQDAMRITHVVGKNENLVNIAAAYKVSVVDIMKWNDLNSNNVYSGQKLIIYINM